MFFPGKGYFFHSHHFLDDNLIKFSFGNFTHTPPQITFGHGDSSQLKTLTKAYSLSMSIRGGIFLNRSLSKLLALFISVSTNEVLLSVDTTHLKRFGLWKSKDDDHSGRSHAILFLWVSSQYLQEIQTQLENPMLSQQCEYKDHS